MCNLFCFLWPSRMIFWGIHIKYIYKYRWDLAATSLADILDLDATSVKKTHSHSPPLSSKNKSKTKLLNPCPKPLTFPQGYLFFLGFYMVSNGTRDLKQAETTTNKFAMPKGGKWQRVRSTHFFCQSLKRNNGPRQQNTKKPKKQQQTKNCTPQGEGVRCSLLGLVFVLVSCFFFVGFLFCLCKKKRNCKGEIAKSKLTHCRCIKHLKRRAPTVACSV